MTNMYNAIYSAFYYILGLSIVLGVLVAIALWAIQLVKNIRTKQYGKAICDFASFALVPTAVLSWFFNIGWIRVFIAWGCLSLIVDFAFTYLTMHFFASYMKYSHLLKIYVTLNYIARYSIYMFFPDFGDYGTPYMFFGLIHHENAALIGFIIVIVAVICCCVFTALQVLEVFRIHRREKIRFLDVLKNLF